jgi:hypothetical protein
MATVAPRKHSGFKAAPDCGANGLFAEMHPSWNKLTPLQELLRQTLDKSNQNQNIGVISEPNSDTTGE